MQFFRNLPIRAKLFGGFGIVLALAVIVGVVLIVQMSSINAGGDYVATKALPGVQLTGKMDRDIVDYRGAQVRFVLESQPALQDLQKAQWTKHAADVDAGLQQYKSTFFNAEDRQMWQTVSQEWTDYQQATKRMDVVGRAADATAAVKQVHLTDPLYARLANSLNRWLQANIRWGNDAVRANHSTFSSAKTLGIVLLVIAVLVGGLIAFLVSRSIKNVIDVVLGRLGSLRDHCATDLKAGIEALADGDLTVPVQAVTPVIENPSADELGQVAAAVNALRERFGAAIDAYNLTRQNLTDLVGEVSGSAGVVSLASQQMASTSEEAGRATGEIANAVGGIAQGAERQVHVVEQARAAAEEVNRAVNEAAESAQQTAEVANEAREVAHRGVGAAEQATEAMRAVRDSSSDVSAAIRELAEKSEQIGAIVQTITGIAEQTNLLALNAAIEAARAGEQGRGFAVVAEEVRKLAEESQAAAGEISGLIGAIQQETNNAVSVVEDGARRTDDGATVVEQTREAFLQIGNAVEDMTARIEQIAAVSEEIAASAQSMQENISEVAAVAEESSASTEEVSASTEETSASTEQIAASAQELSGNAEALSKLVARFKLYDQES